MKNIRCNKKEFNILLNHYLKNGYITVDDFYNYPFPNIDKWDYVYLLINGNILNWNLFHDDDNFIKAKQIIRQIKINKITDDK